MISDQQKYILLVYCECVLQKKRGGRVIFSFF